MSGLRFEVPNGSHAELTLRWRTKPEIARFMLSEVRHGVTEQAAWLERCRIRRDYRHWLIVHAGRPIGLINLQGIDVAAGSSSSGFYIGEDDCARLAGFALACLYNHAFHELGFIQMHAQVLDDNVDVLRLHRAHGYVETGRRELSGPGGVVRRLHALTLARASWLEQRGLQRYRAEFPWAQPLPEPVGSPAEPAGPQP